MFINIKGVPQETSSHDALQLVLQTWDSSQELPGSVKIENATDTIAALLLVTATYNQLWIAVRDECTSRFLLSQPPQQLASQLASQL